MPNFLKKLFPSANEREVKRLMRQVEAVNDLEPRYEAMSDLELAGQTQIFRDQLKDGSTLEDILPKAYALVREGAKRVFGKRLFDMQILGGIVLHQGRIAEMKTG
ncbi:MAG: preprotein translocase subunit SecA, partial [Christensenellaceae bacterium]